MTINKKLKKAQRTIVKYLDWDYVCPCCGYTKPLAKKMYNKAKRREGKALIKEYFK